MRIALVLAACLAAASGCGSGTVRRSEGESRAYPAGVAQLRWRTSIHEQGLFVARPEECAAGAVVDSRLVIGSRDGKIVGLQVSNGNVLWRTPVSGGIDSEARFDPTRRQVYVGSDDGTLYAVEPEHGAIRWTYKGAGAVERMPEIGDDSVFISTASDRVVALDAGNGRWKWQYDRETPEGFTIHGHSGPRLREGVIYAGFSDGYLVAMQSASGEPLWARSLASASEQFVDIDMTPLFIGDLVVASSYSGGLYALGAREGDLRWRAGMEGVSAGQVADDRLYVGAPREGLAALTRSGQVLWRQGLADAGDLTVPRVAGPYLVFSGSRAGLFIVDRESGRLLEVFNPGRGMCAPPTLDATGHDLYVLANSGSVYALRLVW